MKRSHVALCYLSVVIPLLCLFHTHVVRAGLKVTGIGDALRRDWAVAPPHIFVLAIGIDHYPGNLFMNLEGSVNDAEMLGAIFKSSQFSSRAEVHVLTEQGATKEAIRAAIQKWAQVANPEDLFILSFSGQQGSRSFEEASGEVYMAPADAIRKPDCKEGFVCADEKSLISGALLYSWMTQIRARRQILLLDTGLTERAIPVIERYWRREACNVGPAAAKRILLLTNHGYGLERQINGKTQGLLSFAASNALRSTNPKLAEPGAADGKEFPLLTAVGIQQSVYRQFLALSDVLPDREKVRAELVGGDFVISGPAGQEARPEQLFLDSGLGPVCTGDKTSRGFDASENDAAAPAVPESVSSKNYALVVATDNYENWQHLSNPIFDAKTIEADLQNIYGFEVEHLLDPSRQELKSKLDQLHSRRFGPDDQVFIFIAGHGDYDATNDIGYLVFKNTPAGHDYDSDMNLMELRSRIDSIQTNHVLLVMDSCFAGSLDPEMGGPGSRSEYDPIPLKELVKRSADKRTRIFLTSGSKEYVPDGQPGHHSPFAALLINAFETKGGRDEYVSLAKLPQYFQRLATTARMGNLGHNQAGSEFFFIPQHDIH